MQQRRQAYLDALAGRLGVSKDQLGNAMKQARIDQINKAVAEGRLDQERANRIIQAIQSGQRFQRPAGPNGADANQQGGPPRGPGQRPDGRPVGPPGSPMEMRGEGMLAANVLGMTPQELRAAMMAGKSLAQIAQDKGISRDDLKAKLIAAQKTRLDQAVSEGRMSADQAKQIADRFAANVDRQIDMVPGQRRGPQRPAGTN
jgi:hypothetical protein